LILRQIGKRPAIPSNLAFQLMASIPDSTKKEQ